MATTPEKDFQHDLEALRADIAALTETVGSLATQAVKGEAAASKGMKKAAKNAIGTGSEENWSTCRERSSSVTPADWKLSTSS